MYYYKLAPRVYNQLLRTQFIKEIGCGVSTKNGGRKPVMAELNVNYGFVASIDMSADAVKLMYSRLNGKILHFQSFKTSDMTLTDVIDLIEDQLRNVDDYGTIHGLMGVAIALDGIIYENKILKTPIKGLTHFDLAKYLRDKLRIPVVLEKKANLTAVFERDFHDNEIFDNVVSVVVRDQIHAGIVADSRLYSGHEGEAGEVGTALLEDRHVEDHLASVNDYASEKALWARLKAIKHVDRLDLTTVKHDYINHDPEVTKVFDDFVYYLSKVIANVSTAFAPDVVVLNTTVLEILPQLLTNVRESTAKLTSPSRQVPIIATENVQSAALLGGASVIIHQALGLESLKMQFS
ncbi:ROK family protein [Lactiplantibacillus plantarum]|uniref:ROK family protein n=1 Tax=Lactiplantibacillus plantarum TaxID=1590 RepID=UPI001EE826F7|nr:ROK family protein [Lactiplantibacillus plantarum]